VYKAPGARLEVVEVPDPTPSAGEMIVRVKDCGICGSDLHAAKYGFKMPPGTIMGHEFSAVVDEIGAGVTGFKPGDPVVVMSYVACGECESCRTGKTSRCRKMKGVGFGEVPGAYAEKMKTTPGSCYKMPSAMSHRLGATVEPLVVGLHGVHRAQLRAGETCVIMGAGPIGLVTLQWARFAGARTIVVSEMADGRRDKALEMGADAAVHPRVKSPSAMIQEMTGAPPDVVFECIGAAGTLDEAVTYARRGGRVVVLGVCMEDDSFRPMQALNRELDIRFSLGLEPGEIETAIDMSAAGRVSTEAMITHVIGIDELPNAFAALSRPSDQTKVMIEF
jgi:(R,R)-butanediol dehydrogenase/meso-butanediol dehydrogenase/diacetyl reductase